MFPIGQEWGKTVWLSPMLAVPARHPTRTAPVVAFRNRSTSCIGGTLSEQGLYIGTEFFTIDETTPLGELSGWERSVVKPADGLPCTMLHELMHYQQDTAPDSSLLAQSVVEGSADFLAHVVAGCSPDDPYTAYGEAHEAALWAEFRSEMRGDDISNWLYQGDAAGDRPADLGYYVGYRIAEAYYKRAEDKAQALHDILHVQDFDAFLGASGYAERFGG